jgi:hypothetical protein
MKRNRNKPKQKRRAASGERGFNRASVGLHGRLVAIMSNLRFSLTLRIAIHYALQLLRTTLPIAVLMFLVFCAAQTPGIWHTMERLSSLAPENGSSYTALQVMDPSATAELKRNILPSASASRAAYVLRQAFSTDLFRWPPVLHLLMGVPNGTLVVSYDLRERLQVFLYLLGGLVLCDLLRVWGFLRKRNKLNKTVLQPLREIADLAATLSANNLSNRINIAGTKNEL